MGSRTELEPGLVPCTVGRGHPPNLVFGTWTCPEGSLLCHLLHRQKLGRQTPVSSMMSPSLPPRGACAVFPPWRLGPLIRADNGAGGGECFQGCSWSAGPPGPPLTQVCLTSSVSLGTTLSGRGWRARVCVLWPRCPTTCALCLS